VGEPAVGDLRRDAKAHWVRRAALPVEAHVLGLQAMKAACISVLALASPAGGVNVPLDDRSWLPDRIPRVSPIAYAPSVIGPTPPGRARSGGPPTATVLARLKGQLALLEERECVEECPLATMARAGP
jgi:hypothetical protein